MASGDFTIEKGVEIDVEHLDIGSGTVIKKGSTIRCKSLTIGRDVVLESGTNISSFRGQRADTVVIGDNCSIGKDVNFSLPVLVIGDYVTIHKSVGMFGEKPGVIGHNTWIGERAILNTCGFLYLGNNIGIGAGSHIWTHVGQGELLEGCLLWGDRPVILEDDTWLVDGQITISPGVVLRKKSCILPGSVITKDTLPAHAYSGIPAKDITDKVPVYREVSLDEKYALMHGFLMEFMTSLEGRRKASTQAYGKDGTIFAIKGLGSIVLLREWDRKAISDIRENVGLPLAVVCLENRSATVDEAVSVFEITSKQYRKNRTSVEVEFMKFMKGYRARFVPSEKPVLGLSLLREYCPDYARSLD